MEKPALPGELMATQLFPAVPYSFTAPPEEQPGTLSQFGFYALALYLFLIVSRAPELIAMRFGSSFYQIFISSILCAAFLFITGALWRVIGSRLSIIILLLHLWYALSVPFSYWKGGSVDGLMNVARYAPTFYFIAGLIQSEKHLRWAFTAMRAAMLVALFYTMTAPVAESEDNRLQLEGGRFANSNEIAMYMLFGLPFWLHMAAGKRFGTFVRLLAGVEILLSFYQCFRTGSRSGLITIVVIGVIIFFMSSAINKLKIILVTVFCAMVAFPLLPQSVRDRLYSITGDYKDTSAGGSSESRFNLLMESIDISARHPLLGVGIGVYASAAAEISANSGGVKRWQVSHNAYTQISAECGLPALFLFIGTLVTAWQLAWKGRSLSLMYAEMDDLSLMSGCMILLLIIYMISGCFANLGQELFYYVVVGFAFVCGELATRRYTQLSAARAQNDRRRMADDIAAARPNQQQQETVPAQAPAAPVIGRPLAISPEEQYGNAPWARSPRRRP